MEAFPARSYGNVMSNDINRRYDEVRFVDITFLMNWEDFFSTAMDKQVQLGVKGPHTNHCFIFEAREVISENGNSYRQVLTSCKRFMSASDKDVPMILPDLTSTHWKEYKKLSNKVIVDYDPESCAEEINSLITTGVKSKDGEQLKSDITLLGLRAFKISNSVDYIFNICEKNLNSNDLNIAPFESRAKAHLSYDYCDHVRTNTDRFSDQEKQDILDFMTFNFPSKLQIVNKEKGFPSNAASDFVQIAYGTIFLLLLQNAVVNSYFKMSRI
jgi:hypothetical protein